MFNLLSRFKRRPDPCDTIEKCVEYSLEAFLDYIETNPPTSPIPKFDLSKYAGSSVLSCRARTDINAGVVYKVKEGRIKDIKFIVGEE
jgi:hypothetical protein